MQFRDITVDQFDVILAELSDVEHQVGTIHTVSGQHEAYGMTVLARDGSHCVALVDDPRRLDSQLAGPQCRAAVETAPAPVRSTSGRRGTG